MNAIKKMVYERAIPLLGKIFIGRNKYVNVIYFHDIVNGKGDGCMEMNIDVFKSQMEYIAEQHIQTLRFDDLKQDQAVEFEKDKVLIVFDDGFKSNYYAIFDFMKELGIKYNIFLVSGMSEVDARMLDWEETRKMHESGLVGFGAHTFTHPDMTHLKDFDLNHEIIDANKVFKEELGFVPEDFCFPYGAYSEETLQAIIDCHVYKRIYTSKMMYSYRQNDAIVMGRTPISNEDSIGVFTNKLYGYYNVWSTIIK